jgi:hypothetical protein
MLLDFCHVNHRGNELVAAQIYERYLLPESGGGPNAAGLAPAATQSSASSPR